MKNLLLLTLLTLFITHTEASVFNRDSAPEKCSLMPKNIPIQKDNKTFKKRYEKNIERSLTRIHEFYQEKGDMFPSVMLTEKPRINVKQREGVISNKINIEGFIRPDDGINYMVPIIGVSFVADEYTSVYICVNIDSLRPHNNYIVLYFLELTNKRRVWPDNPNLMFGANANISAKNIKYSPVSGVTSVVEKLFEGVPLLNFVSKTAFRFTSFTETVVMDYIFGFMGGGLKRLWLDMEHVQVTHAMNLFLLEWETGSADIDLDEPFFPDSSKTVSPEASSAP